MDHDRRQGADLTLSRTEGRLSDDDGNVLGFLPYDTVSRGQYIGRGDQAPSAKLPLQATGPTSRADRRDERILAVRHTRAANDLRLGVLTVTPGGQPGAGNDCCHERGKGCRDQQ